MTRLPLLLALACLLCAGLNDFVFKLYSRKARSVGLYFCLVGCVWTTVFAVRAGSSLGEPFTAVSVWWGSLSGFCSVVANILLVRAMKHHEVGMCATIYRLNLVPAALLAFLFLGETLSVGKVLGVACATGAVLLFYQANGKNGQAVTSAALAGMVLASFLRAGMGLFYKCGTNHGADETAILVINGGCWIVGGLAYYLAVERRAPVSLRNVTKYGLISGGLASGIVGFMIFALKYGDASMVLPISQLSFVVTALLGAATLREPFTRRKVAGLALACLCVLFMLASDRTTPLIRHSTDGFLTQRRDLLGRGGQTGRLGRRPESRPRTGNQGLGPADQGRAPCRDGGTHT